MLSERVIPKTFAMIMIPSFCRVWVMIELIHLQVTYYVSHPVHKLPVAIDY